MNLKKIIRSFYRSLIRKYWSFRLWEIGQDTVIEGDNCSWDHPEAISLGSNVLIKSGCRLSIRDTRGNPGVVRIKIGDNSSLQPGCRISAAEMVTIGKNVLVAGKVFISDHDHVYDHPTTPAALLRDLNKAAVTIEDGCWLGYSCVILKGVTIGKRSVIGANAVVTRDIPPCSVAVGNPARIVKKINVQTEM